MTSSTKSLIAAVYLEVSPYFLTISLMNSDFTRPKMQFISLRCISRILENLMKIYNSCVVDLEISLLDYLEYSFSSMN